MAQTLVCNTCLHVENLPTDGERGALLDTEVIVREAHLRWCSDRGLRPNTILAKRSALQRFERAIAPVHPKDATADHVKRWYETVGGLAQHRHCELSHIRQFFSYLQREGHRSDDPTIRLMAPKIRRRLPRPISQADLTKALQLAPEPLKSWLLFGALAGLRSCEIAPLHRDDLILELDDPVIYVVEGKGGRDRTIPMHPKLLELADLHLPESGYLWPHEGGAPSAMRVMRMINAYFRSIDVRATGHMLRHYFCTHYYEASGCDLLSTQEVMGHSSPVHTAIYTKWSMRKAAASVAAIPI